MTIRVKDFDVEKLDRKIAKIDAWYDRHTRLWCIELQNKDGYQIGEAIWVYGKTDKDATVAELREEYNI